MPDARYDGFAAWYEEFASGFAPAFANVLAARVADLVEPGAVVLDIGCGTGLYAGALRERGLRPVGVDLSGDQLRIASDRGTCVLRADASILPVRDAAIPVAVAAFVHTDIDDFSSTVTEVARVLQPGGRFVYIGTHPCFIGPFIKRTTERDERTLVVRPGYGDAGLVFDGSGSTAGLKAKVGSRNLGLGEFLSAFTRAGLRIESLEELDTRARAWVAEPDDGTIVPWNLLLVAAKASQ
jgi:SAM-dependent methyltransferase